MDKGKEMITNVKMIVTPDLVERIQEIVFANGGYWCSGTQPSKDELKIICSVHIGENKDLSCLTNIVLYEIYPQEEISAYDFIASQGEQKWLPKYGEECEASNNEQKLYKDKFVAYIPQVAYKYITTKGSYKYCRQLPKIKTITIDGKDIEISADSFEALKKQICEGQQMTNLRKDIFGLTVLVVVLFLTTNIVVSLQFSTLDTNVREYILSVKDKQ